MALPEPSAEVLAEARRGDPAAFGTVVRLYQDFVYRLAFRMVWDAHEAFDLSQEVFLRLHRAWDRFDPGRPFGPWFFRLATNVCLNGLKRLRRRPATFQSLEGEEAAFEPAGEGPAAADAAGDADLTARVREAVTELPPDYRLIVSLRYMKGLSYEEVGEILDLPLGTVKNRLFRARERLKGLLALQGVREPD